MVEAEQTRPSDTPRREATSRAGVSFNGALRKACGNTLLATLAASLEKRARFYFGMVEGDLGSDWIAVEERLLKAISQSNPALVAETSKDHILSTGQAVSRLLEQTD